MTRWNSSFATLQSYLASERARGDAAKARADRAHVQQVDLGTAQAEADALRRAEAERRARGPLAKVRAACRRE